MALGAPLRPARGLMSGIRSRMGALGATIDARRWPSAQRRMLRRAILREEPARRRGHDLPGELIVSLTSYPPRFGTLDLTLLCLLRQSLRPDRITLWIAHGDMPALPDRIRKLPGIDIRPCADIRSYKKLAFAMRGYPDAWIVTVDDDLHLPPDWLAKLVSAAAPGRIAAHRAHRITRHTDGRIKRYAEWDHELSGPELTSHDLLATTGSGILYPPGSLGPMASDIDAALRLCPTGDDLWFGWAARQAGTPVTKLAGDFPLVTWRGSQRTSLWLNHNQVQNDLMIARLESFVDAGAVA